MFLLKLLRPAQIPDKKEDWTIRIKMYHWMLRTMIPLYLRGMIFDTFSLGDIQVKHNVRDCWFENELSRFKIVIKKRLINGVIPYHKKHCRFKHSNYFNWSETLVIDKNGKKFCIQYDKDITINTDIKGILRVPVDYSFMQCSEFFADDTKQQEKLHNDDKSNISNKNKIHVKDKILEISQQKVLQEKTQQKKAGFDLNDIF